MTNKINPKIILLFLVFSLIFLNYSLLDNYLVNTFVSEKETFFITRVIDGDTAKSENLSIRLLGINTPERGEEYYNEAKQFLQEQIFNKTIQVESGKDKYDRYNRMLAYVILNGENINKKLIENGFANYYFPSGKDFHYAEFKQAWETCLEKKINLCEKSSNSCADCIELKKFDNKNQVVIFENICDFNCELTNWKIKDQGRKNFIFPEFILEPKKEVSIIVGNQTNTKEKIYWSGEKYVWTKTGDTLFLRDDKNKLVLWSDY